MFGKKRISAAIEIGTKSVKVLLGTEDEESRKIDFLAGYEQLYKTRSHNAMRRGAFHDAPRVIDALQTALEQALKLCENTNEKRFYYFNLVPHISNCYVAFSCDKITAKITQATRTLGVQRETITEKDQRALREELLNYSNPGFYTLHNIESSYHGEQDAELNSLVGHLLNHYVQKNLLISCDEVSAYNMYHRVKEVTGISPTSMSFSAIADYYAINHNASEQDKSEGLLIINIGEGLTEFSVYRNNRCRYVGAVAVGCAHATNDIALAFSQTFEVGELIIKQHSKVQPDRGYHEDDMALPNAAMISAQLNSIQNSIEDTSKAYRIKKHTVELVLYHRFSELFEIIKKQLVEAQMERNVQRVVICGGGALFDGITKLASDIFEIKHVSIGGTNEKSLNEEFRGPRFTTVAGLLIKAVSDDELKQLKWHQQWLYDFKNFIQAAGKAITGPFKP